MDGRAQRIPTREEFEKSADEYYEDMRMAESGEYRLRLNQKTQETEDCLRRALEAEARVQEWEAEIARLRTLLKSGGATV